MNGTPQRTAVGLRRAIILACQLSFTVIASGESTIITIDSARPQQEFQGMGCGAIFYEGHIVSLAERGRVDAQEQLYDDMFARVRTDYLHLFIRHDHEPSNDNDDPYTQAFDDKNFKYAEKTVAICAAARKRQPQMKLYATLYTPPAWMKTNGEPGGGGKTKGTIKPGLELEMGEYCWAFLDYMHRHGQTIEYLSIANEPDWPHTQPGCFLTPEQHAGLFAKIATYLEQMALRRPEVPAVKLVGPNVLSAVSCATKYLPQMLQQSPGQLAVIGSHDYDRRGHRWNTLRDMSGGRPVWCTEWCVNGKDESPDLIRSAGEYWLAMIEAFNDGANVWMAYDWVYPPRQGGEALIHLNWGKDYHCTKIYHAFLQWCSPLVPGMKVVPVHLTGPGATGISQPGVKVSAFLAPDGKRLVVHAAAVQKDDAELEFNFGDTLQTGVAKRTRTSGNENGVSLPDKEIAAGRLCESLPGHGLLTIEITPAK